MAIVLGDNQYGKTEIRLVQVRRGEDSHDVRDLNVSVTLAGDLSATHLTGDNSGVLPTDTQKNTVYAFAAQYGVGEIEDFGARLAGHFVDSQPSIQRARVCVEEYRWERLGPYSFQRSAGETRTATVSYDGTQTWVVAGLTGLLLFNSTGSEFHGYVKDRYTTLPEATDRILATAVNARWRYRSPAANWTRSYMDIRQALLDAFAGTYSLSLQQTLYAMGQHAVERCPEAVEVRLSLPNKHHFAVDLKPFGLPNSNEIFYAADRPYGLIEGTVLRDDAPPAGLAWW